MHPTRIFRTPEDMLEAWDGYKLNLRLVEDEKWVRVQYVGRDGDKKRDAMKVPLTLEGFKRYCRELHGEVEHYFSNTDKRYNDFCGICSRIREEIREDQVVGAMLGVYNPSITARLNGLTDKQQVEHSGTIETITGMKIIDGNKP